jgi:3-isopropylmalate/(R)-2-methylmalate dehydratase small subunit
MTPFRVETSRAAPLTRANIDTDQILPARFLRKPRGDGYHPWLFHDLRHAPDGSQIAGFVLNQPDWADARFILGGPNFGCGSSREGAVYALIDAGFRAVLAPSFGDIFFNNACKNGLLPVVISIDGIDGEPLTIDLEALEVRLADGRVLAFQLDSLQRECLLAGLDDIGLTRQHAADIIRFEATRPRW